MNTELVQIRCKSLRSKSSYGVFDDSDEEILQLTGSTATYWCLKTMSKAGPDRRADLAGKAAVEPAAHFSVG